METFNARDAAAAGLPVTWVQDNHSQSSRGVLRGLHFQYPQWQGKLVRVARGEIFDVAVRSGLEAAPPELTCQLGDVVPVFCQ